MSVQFPDGEELIRRNDYVFVLGNDGGTPWIGQAKKFVRKGPNVVTAVRWLYNPDDLPGGDPRAIRGPRELVATDHTDEIDLKSLMGVAKVLENYHDCLYSKDWCWREVRTGIEER